MITVIGGGLAGCEAAWVIAEAGLDVLLYEMRPGVQTPAHTGGLLAELVCSNSLKSEDPDSASGVLKSEMRALGSLVLQAAQKHRVPAGLNLSVDREEFAREVTDRIQAHPRIRLKREVVLKVPQEGIVVLASGPLTHPDLEKDLASRLGRENLFFFDAVAPIVTEESLDLGVAFKASRYGKGEADYLNCPMDQAQYQAFILALTTARRHPVPEFDKGKLFEGCLPLEEMADRGEDTLRFGPLKPVGLKDPSTGKRPYACLQLRRENAAGSLYNLVGFQTRLEGDEQKRVFRLIPGLQKAEFTRLGRLHRNTFINAPELLRDGCQWKADGRVFFAGQVAGVEGYLESAAFGILAGLNAARQAKGQPLAVPPRNTVMGSLAWYLQEADPRYFQPMNANWGLVEPAEAPPGKRKAGKKERYAGYSERARMEFGEWLKTL
jgi:methylenetetrahydrofolate--tRNA-(uracil-5-)-methyltransferase